MTNNIKKIGLWLLLIASGANAWATKVVYRFEKYTGGTNYFWLFNGDVESVNSIRTHHLVEVSIECASPDCSLLKLKYRNEGASDSFEISLSSQRLEEILNGRERIIHYPSHTRENFRWTWSTAMNFDKPGVGVWFFVGAFLSVFTVPSGIVHDVYNACHGDGSCKLQLKNAVTKLESLKRLPGDSVTYNVSFSEIRDLANFVAAVGKQSKAALLDSPESCAAAVIRY